MGPVTWSNNFFHQTPLLIDNETFRDTSGTIEAFNRSLDIEQGGKRQAIVTHEGCHDLRSQGIETHGQHCQTAGMKAFMKALDRRHLFDTRRAPCGPNVNEHDL